MTDPDPQEVPFETFDWRIHEQGQCRSILYEGGWCCQRPAGHEGPHAYNMRWFSGDPAEHIRDVVPATEETE